MSRSTLHHRPSRRLAIVTTAALIALSACGGSDESGTRTTTPSTESATASTEATPTDTTAPAVSEPTPTDAPDATEPPTTNTPAATDAPPTTEFVLGADTVPQEFGGGFVSLDIWPGWDVAESSDELDRSFENPAIASVPWSFDIDEAQVLVGLGSGDARFGILREPHVVAAGSYAAFRAGVRDAFGGGQPPNFETPQTWAGLDGDYMSFDFGEVRTAEVDGQYVAAVSSTLDDPELAEQVDAMLDNVDFDTSGVGPLTDAWTLAFEIDAAGSYFAAVVDAPRTWTPREDGDSLSYGDPLTGSFASVTITASLGDLESFVERVSSAGLIEGDAVRVDGQLVDEFGASIDYVVLWEGPPNEANRALILADDGIYGSVILIETAALLIGDEPAGGRLIDQMVASVYFSSEALAE